MAATGATASHAQSVVFNEVCAANIDQWVDPSFNYGGWVELYNPSSQAVDVTGWYLSDDASRPLKARINQTMSVPAGGYVTLWMDHYHKKYGAKMLDMKLDADGGTLYLSDANGQLVASLEYPVAVARCSWARVCDSCDSWNYCSAPTPDQTNAGAPMADLRLEAPLVEGESQLFASGTVEYTVQIPEGCTLRYTTDGSAPTLSNGYTTLNGKLTASATRMFRFRLFRDGYLPSPVVTRIALRSSYDIDLPILSVTGTQSDFYGDSMGIFVQGKNGRPGNGQSGKCNWNMDWERPAAFSYFTADGEEVLNQEVGIERCGGWSRAWSPSSFKVKAGKEYEGQNSLPYPFFAEKPYLKHKALQVRNGGNDNGCRIKDAALQQIVARSGIDIDYQAYQPVAHFVNGVWKGAINLREPNNKHFVLANYGWDDDEIDQFEMSPDSGYCQKCGTKEALDQLLTLSKSVGSQPEAYEQVKQLLDLDEYCNYMAIEFYLRNTDWPQNNLKGWREHANGRFRFVLYDLDGFDWTTGSPFTTFAGKQTHTFDRLYDSDVSRYTKEIEMVTLFLNLLNNAEFRQKFIDTFCLVTYCVFEPSRCSEIINELASRVSHTQALYNDESPWWTANSLISALTSSRQTTLMNSLKSYSKMQLSGRTIQQINVMANTSEAHLTFNGMPVPGDVFKGQFYSPATVSASAPTGDTFTGWKQLSTTMSTLISTTGSWKYYDQGSLDDSGWQTSTYDDSSWRSGRAPLGYYTGGSRDYNTTLSYGSDANNKRPTYYFRTTLDLNAAPHQNDQLLLDYTCDDGFILYVNGVEAARYNMPSGTVTYSTYASTYANGNPDSGTMQLSPSLFHEGTNLIAVELHNNSGNSSDVYWSAQLTHAAMTGSTLVSSEPEYSLPTSGPVSLIACFERSASADLLPPVMINEVSANNAIYVNDRQKKEDWIELYNTTDQAIDLRGMYLTNDPSEPQKWCIGDGLGDDAAVETVIPAHGYQIIWCDKKDAVRQLHAPFKLSNDDGQQVTLSAADGSWSDTLTYCAQEPAQTVGRYPDGAAAVYLMNLPTIDQANRYSSLCQTIDQPTEAIRRILTDDMLNDGYEVFDLNGRLVAAGRGALAERLTQGIYVVRSHGLSQKVVVP